MILVLALIWAISAAIAWECQADALQGRGGRWKAITIGSLLPVYNTLVAWGYARESLMNSRREKR